MISPRIFFLCPHVSHISGGIRMIYRHVYLLISGGFDAVVVHQSPAHAPRELVSDHIRVVYPPLEIRPNDVVVFSEIEGPDIVAMAAGMRKVIFNQNPYYTFRNYPLNLSTIQVPYIHPTTLATITVSEDAQAYLMHTFPGARVLRVRLGIDPSLYSPIMKKGQIAFMPRKHPEDARQVLNILASRNALEHFSLLAIQDATIPEAAAALRESLVFLSFGYPEGFGLPPAEAMSCGCVVIGYHGMGGREYFSAEHGFPVEIGDIIGFARTTEKVLGKLRNDRNAYSAMTRRAATFINSNYSLAVERESVLQVWQTIMSL